MKNLKNTLITLLLMFVVFIPTKVFAENYGENFKKILTNGKLVINSVSPKTVPDTYFIIHELPFYDENGNSRYGDLSGYFSVESIDEDYNGASIDYTDKTTYQLIENHEVPIQYNYDKNILKEVEKLVKGLPREKDFYVIDDMEY